MKAFFLSQRIFAVTLGLWGAFAQAAYDHPANIRLPGPVAVIVTHSTQTYDDRRTTERGLGVLLNAASERGVPILSLEDPREEESQYFLPPSLPRAGTLISGGGEFDTEKILLPPHIVSAGGYFERCEFHTVLHALLSWAKAGIRLKQKLNLKFTHYADAVYTSASYVNRGGNPPSRNPSPDLSKLVPSIFETRTLREVLASPVSQNSNLAYYDYVVSEAIEIILGHVEPKISAFYRGYNIRSSHDGKIAKRFHLAGNPNAPTLTFELITGQIEEMGADQVFALAPQVPLLQGSKKPPIPGLFPQAAAMGGW